MVRKGNVIWYPCGPCNLVSSFSTEIIMVFTYELSMHVKHFLKQLSERGISNVLQTRMKNANSIGSLTINNKIVIVDGMNHFNSQQLHSLIQSMDDTDLYNYSRIAKDKRGLPIPSVVLYKYLSRQFHQGIPFQI